MQHSKGKKEKIVFNAADQQVISSILGLEKKWKTAFTATPKSLSIQQVVKICCAEWGVDEKRLQGRIVHSDRLDKLVKTSVLWAHFYFSTETFNFATDFVGCSATMYFNCREFIYYAIVNAKDEYSRILLNIAHACSKATGHRLFKLDCIDPQTIEGLSEWDLHDHLNRYQRTKIPVREQEWFLATTSKHHHMIACSTSDQKIFWCNAAYFKNDVSSLLRMQNQGYRFYDSDSKDWNTLRTAHPICDRCFKKNDCGMKSHAMFGGYLTGDFKCFVEPADQPLKIDVELLYALPQHRLQ